MFINIVTPCSRPENLFKIEASINIQLSHCRWIVVIDAPEPLKWPKFPKNANVYYHQEKGSKWGNGQRNFALDMIYEGYVYFLDDDTLLHPDLFNNLFYLENDFIHFDQQNKDGSKRLGGSVKFKETDSGNVLISRELIGDTRWVLNRYGADGIFMEEVFSRAKSPIYIQKSLSIYNALR